MTTFVVTGMIPAAVIRASVTWDAISLMSPEASMTAYTLYPSALACSAGKATHTLVHTPAMTSVFRPVASTALTKSALSQALTSPLRATYLALGATSASSGMMGPLVPAGSEAVVMIG